MLTLILPGFSIKNKEWANQTREQLNTKFPTEVVAWQHWQTETPEDNWIEKEAQRIIDRVGEDRVNVLAKSIGTAVAMTILKLKPDLISRLILCGVPLHDLSEADKLTYFQLKDFSFPNLICFQNESDNHGNFAEVTEFLHAIDPEIKIISKPRADHEYPYSEDFINFLES